MDAKLKIEMITEGSKKPIEVDYTNVSEIRIRLGDTSPITITAIQDETMQALQIDTDYGSLICVQEDVDEATLFPQRI